MNKRNTNCGLIRSNDRKAIDTNPDYTGSLNVKGEDFLISAWKQKGDDNPGAETLSFSVRPKDKTTVEQPKDYIVNTDNQSGDRI